MFQQSLENESKNKSDIVLVPSNLIIETPKGHMLMLALRSSTPKKKNLFKPHGIGIIDNDYCGEKDEIKVQVYNFSDEEVVVDKGEKIAQSIFVKIDKAEWEEVEEINNKTRGGFGSTDKK